MSHIYAHINTCRQILEEYKGDVPLSLFLKAFFAKDRKYGSRDRRNISELCYNYFRTGELLIHNSFEEKLLLSMFLCNTKPNDYLQKERPDWYESISINDIRQKLAIAEVKETELFPLNHRLSSLIDIPGFTRSFLLQPLLFVRVRPEKGKQVREKLEKAQQAFEKVSDSCLAFPNGTKLDQLLEVNKEVVIQDLNSQRIGELISKLKVGSGYIWDCCAASGGKAILAHDILPKANLTVSDIRPSIIHNLRKRLAEAGISNYRSFVADISNPYDLEVSLGSRQFDFIICDAPCSGSGTWGRTPEQLLYFKEDKIEYYSNLQKQIVSNVIPFIKKGGFLLYITCSVFANENEDVADFIATHPSVILLECNYYKGYDRRADTMFGALFQKQ